MADMITMEQAEDKFGKKGVANSALGLAIGGLGVALLNGGLGGIFGGGTSTATTCTNADSNACAFVSKDTFWQQNVDLEKELGVQRYDNLKANYDLYITLDNKISALAQNQATVNAQLPLMFQLANMTSERYTDQKVCAVDKTMALGFMGVESQLAKKIDGDLKLPWSSIYSGIPVLPQCALDVTCPSTGA